MLGIKIQTQAKAICQGIPGEFLTFLKYTKELQFEEEPDYDWARALFKSLYNRIFVSFDNVFDWNYQRNSIYQV